MAYVSLVRELQREGPYHLVGRRGDGRIAHAIACLMRQQGHQVGMLAVVDGKPPERGTTGASGRDVFGGDLLLIDVQEHHEPAARARDGWAACVSGRVTLQRVDVGEAGSDPSTVEREIARALTSKLAALS